MLKKLFVLLLVFGMHAEYQFGSFGFFGKQMRFSTCEIVIAFAFFTLIAYWIYNRNEIDVFIFDKCSVFIIIIFLLGIVISALFAYNKIESLKYIIRIFSTISVVFGFGIYLSKTKLENFSIEILKMVGAVACIVGIFEIHDADFKLILYNTCGWAIGSRQGSATSFFMHNNIFGCWLVVVAWLSTSVLFIKPTHIQKIYIGLLIVLFGYLIILSASRNAWITGALTFLFYFIFWFKKTKENILLVFIVCVFFLFSFFTCSLPKKRIVQTVKELSNFELIYKGKNTRYKLNMDSIHMFIDKPITGVGINNFKELYAKYGDHSDSKSKDLSAHNLWLQFLAELGFIGFIAFLLLTIRLVKIVIYNVKNGGNPAYSMAMFSLLLCSLFDYMWMDYSFLFIFWFVVSLNLLENYRIQQ